MGFRSKYRRSPRRTLVVLLLGFVFCVSASIAGGTFDSGTDPARASTHILTPEEAVAQASEGAGGDSVAAPTLLVALLLLVGGSLLLSLALPTRGEKRREREAAAAPRPTPPVLAYAPPRADNVETTVLPRIVAPPAPSAAAVPARPSPLACWYESRLAKAVPAPPPLIAWALTQPAKAPAAPPCPQTAWSSAHRVRPAPSPEAPGPPTPTSTPPTSTPPSASPPIRPTERRRVGPVRRVDPGAPPRDAEPEARHLSVVHPTPPDLTARAG